MPTRPVETAPPERPADIRPAPEAQAFLERTRLQIDARLAAATRAAGLSVRPSQLLPGKMLRTRMAARLSARMAVPTETLQRACAAVELTHTASLCHDDVIDNARMRRGQPALWRVSSRSGAVLLGDLLLCEAMGLLTAVEDGRLVRPFLAKLHETCAAEAEQELRLRGREVGRKECLRVARGKTGPLFAFVGLAAGGGNSARSAALEEAGYRIGTAYQLADDLLDVEGREEVAGKTLGTDVARRKFTLAQEPGGGRNATRELVAQFGSDALDAVRAWPRARQALAEFLRLDVQPVFHACDNSLHVQVDPLDEV